MPEIGGAPDTLAGASINGRASHVILLSMQDIQTESQIRMAPAGGASQNVTLAEQCGQFTGKMTEL